MGITFRQGKAAVAGAVATVSVVLTSTPNQGNLLCVVVVIAGATASNFSIKDSNNNVYVLSSLSPIALGFNTGNVWMAYLGVAPANASATITASWTTNSINSIIHAAEFIVSGGTASYDKDAAQSNGTATGGGNIVLPSITPTRSNETLFGFCAPNSGTITAPTAGGTLGVWTGITLDGDGDCSEYNLAASSATAANYTDSVGSDPYTGMIMAFAFNPTVAVLQGNAEAITADYQLGPMTGAF